MEEIKVSEMLQADSINKDDSVMIIQEGVNKKASGSIQTATGTSLSLTSVADTCKVKSNSKNLYNNDKPNLLTDVSISSATSQISSTSGATSLYIPIKANTTYTISKASATARFIVGTCSSTPAVGVTCTGIQTGHTSTSLTITSGANDTYLVVWYFLSSQDTGITEDTIRAGIQIEEGETATSYNPYNIKVLVRTKNLITNIIEGYALSGNTGDIAPNSQRAVSDFIKVEGGETYTRSGYTTSGLVWYKADKTRISNDNSNPVTAPANAVYVRLGINTTADYSQAQFEKGTTATSYVKGESQEISLIPQEEKVAFTYDSLTNILSNGSVTIEYATKGRVLNNDDTLAIKEYVDREIAIDEYKINLSYTTIESTYQFFKSNGIATITAGNIWIGASLSANSWLDIGTIPSACIPKTQVTFSTAISDGYNGRVISYGKGSVTTDGKIRVMVSSALTSQNTLGLNFSVTYLTQE